MGEMDLLQGSLAFPKDLSTSFCAQDPWLRVGTRRWAYFSEIDI